MEESGHPSLREAVNAIVKSFHITSAQQSDTQPGSTLKVTILCRIDSMICALKYLEIYP